jgi:septal ring factor EnvC (AmiA/AmiB activator)
MTMRIHTLLPMILLIVTALSGFADQGEIKKRRAELQALRAQIHKYEEQIKEQRQTEDATLELLDSYDKKGTLLRRLVGKLKKEEQEIQQQIDGTKESLGDLESDLSFLRDHYAKYVVSAYKSGRSQDLELLLSSRSINQLTVRNEYLKRFAMQRRSDLVKILDKTKTMQELHARQQQQLSEERRLLAEKGAEEDRLDAVAKERRETLTQVRSDRKLLQQEMGRKIRAARDLESIVARLIEEDRLRQEKAGVERTEVPVVTGPGFETRRGKLRWPVSQGIVVAKFGNQRHPTLRTITQNTGIDISVDAGSPVVAVAQGEVARIWWLPSYGNLIILNHYNGYRTIYTHLAEIFVSKGQRIGEGDQIGMSGESLDGPRLHFEVWKEREKQNPEQWLAKR